MWCRGVYQATPWAQDLVHCLFCSRLRSGAWANSTLLAAAYPRALLGQGPPADSLVCASFAQSEMGGQQRLFLQHGDSRMSLRGPPCPGPGCIISSSTQPLTCSLAPNCSSSFLSRLASISSICTCPAGSRGAAALASTSADARPATKRSSRALSTCCSPAAGAGDARSCKADAGIQSCVAGLHSTDRTRRTQGS